MLINITETDDIKPTMINRLFFGKLYSMQIVNSHEP
jgi:hypothetical protein